MLKVLEIVCLENGDIVLVEAPGEAVEYADQDAEALVAGSSAHEPGRKSVPAPSPLVSIRFSPEVRDMLGDDALGVAEAMIEAATAYISDGAIDAGLANSELGLEAVDFVADGAEWDQDDLDDTLSTTPVVLH